MTRSPWLPALASALALCGCSGGDEAAAPTGPERVPVRVAAATSAEVQRTVRALGTLHGDEDATLSSELTGTVARLRADVGDVVSASAILLELDPEDFEQDVAVARWSLQQTLAQLGLEGELGDDPDLEHVASVARARAQLQNARVKLGRLQQLAGEGRGYVAEQDVEDAQTNVTVAEANLDVERLAARALIAQARQRAAELQRARNRLRDTRIVAPPGRSWAVAERQISVGEYVTQGTALFRLVAHDPLELHATLPERYVPEVRLGQRVTVQVEAYPDEVFEGQVARIQPTVDPASRTFEVQVRVPNPAGALRPGTFARAQVFTRSERAVLVPLEAVVSVGGVSKVFVLEGDQVREVLVEVGGRHADRVEVSALEAGQEVVVSGQTVVTQGAAVEVLSDEEPAQ